MGDSIGSLPAVVVHGSTGNIPALPALSVGLTVDGSVPIVLCGLDEEALGVLVFIRVNEVDGMLALEDEAGMERKLAGEVGFVPSMGLGFPHIAAAALTLLGVLIGEVRGREDEICGVSSVFSLSIVISSRGSSLSSSSSAAAMSPAERECGGEDDIVADRDRCEREATSSAVATPLSFSPYASELATRKILVMDDQGVCDSVLVSC